MVTNNKQLLDEAEHDIKNYSDRGQYYLNNSWCHAKAESNNCFIIHLKTSETYKTIKQSLVMFQVYLFYFRALLSLSCWPCRGLGTTASNNIFFGCKFHPKKLLLDAEHVSSWNYVTSTEHWELSGALWPIRNENTNV
jgi:hypothetical protein